MSNLNLTLVTLVQTIDMLKKDQVKKPGRTYQTQILD